MHHFSLTTSNLSIGVLLKVSVEHSITDLVANLICGKQKGLQLLIGCLMNLDFC